MEFLSSPWIVGTGTAVAAGLILYYVFGIGKASGGKDQATKTGERIKVQNSERQKEYEIELESFRNDMVRRGLAHSSIRLKGEAALRKKFGIQDSATTLTDTSKEGTGEKPSVFIQTIKNSQVHLGKGDNIAGDEDRSKPSRKWQFALAVISLLVALISVPWLPQWFSFLKDRSYLLFNSPSDSSRVLNAYLPELMINEFRTESEKQKFVQSYYGMWTREEGGMFLV